MAQGDLAVPAKDESGISDCLRKISAKFNNCFDNVIVEKKSKLEYNIIPNIQL